MRTVIAALSVALFAAPVAAQDEPERPKLPDTADTSDAEAFYRHGRRPGVGWRETYNAMYWATRLDPTQTRYFLGRFEAAWARRRPEWRRRYLEGDKRVVESREAKEIDSLWSRVLMQDPYPRHPQRTCVVVREVASIRDPLLQGIIWFELGCSDRAAQQWATALERRPELVGLRVDRARALVLNQQYRAATVELQVVLDTLRARDTTTLRYSYESKAFLEYMLGVAHRRGHRIGPARQALVRALVEDLSFYPAHVQLAEIAWGENQKHIAVDEYLAALEANPRDAAIPFNAALASRDQGLTQQAQELLQRAIEIEPHFVMAYYHLAKLTDARGTPDEAIAHYRAYLARAPQSQPTLRAEAEARIAALAGGGG